jgi:hypothetical protein
MDEPRLDEVLLLLDENKESKAIPHCLVCVDFQNKVHLVKILNKEELSQSWLCSDFHEYLEGEEWKHEPGLYTADIDIHTWRDRIHNPESSDWNSELLVSNVTPYNRHQVLVTAEMKYDLVYCTGVAACLGAILGHGEYACLGALIGAILGAALYFFGEVQKGGKPHVE